jgi:hypothetical protein
MPISQEGRSVGVPQGVLKRSAKDVKTSEIANIFGTRSDDADDTLEVCMCPNSG